MVYVGVDGCRSGWFTVALTNGSWRHDIFPDIYSLWSQHKEARLICIDIPIGLKDSGREERTCDRMARKLLCRRGPSVFRVPCRAAVYAKSYLEASRINFAKTGKKLSRQTWGIVPRIREVDQLLVADELARRRIRETHPELCYLALAGHPANSPKKTREGFQERLEILSVAFPDTEALLASALHIPRSKLAKDDILDALVLAVTASRQDHLLAVPEEVELDSKGLPMQIWY